MALRTLERVDGRRLRRREGLGQSTDWRATDAPCGSISISGTSAGYAFVRRKLPLDLPANYEISFDLRGDAPVNNFEVKLADASGDNVWWFDRRDFEFPSEWRRIRIKKRQIAFAWGPTQDRTLRHVDSLEFVVAAGRGGGARLDRDRRSELTRAAVRPPTHFPPLTATASSSLTGADAAPCGRRRRAHRLAQRPKAGAAQSLTVDLGMLREFGGLELRWQDGAGPRRYDVEVSDDGAPGSVLRRVDERRRRATMRCCCPEPEARYIRLDLRDGPIAGYALAELAVKDLAFGASPNAFFQALANEPRAASILAASPASRPTGRSSASTAAARARSCPRTARSKSGEAASRSSRSSCRARASSPGPTSRRPIRCPTAICRSRA